MKKEDTSKIARAIGLRIKTSREIKFDKSLTAAKAWGVTPQTWSAYEGGYCNFTGEKLVELADFLECDVGWLLTGKTASGGSTDDIQTAALEKENLELRDEMAAMERRIGKLRSELDEANQKLEDMRAGLRRSGSAS